MQVRLRDYLGRDLQVCNIKCSVNDWSNNHYMPIPTFTHSLALQEHSFPGTCWNLCVKGTFHTPVDSGDITYVCQA